MDDKPLPHPVHLTLDGSNLSVATVREAHDLLTTRWPEGARRPRHRDAVDTCLKVLDGHRSAVDAEMALREAVKEAGVPLE